MPGSPRAFLLEIHDEHPLFGEIDAGGVMFEHQVMGEGAFSLEIAPTVFNCALELVWLHMRFFRYNIFLHFVGGHSVPRGLLQCALIAGLHVFHLNK